MPPVHWLVTPFPPRVDVLALDGDTYRVHGAFGKDETVSSVVFPRLALRLKSVFASPLTADEQTILDLDSREPPAVYRTVRRPAGLGCRAGPTTPGGRMAPAAGRGRRA